MKSRTLYKTLLKAARSFPAVIITGPRQSGKTTLLKISFSKTHSFFSLENPDARLRAKEDPINFLNTCKMPVILDEIQYVPELLSYIKTRIDEHREPGRWLFTGSQNFALMQNVSQSLAGRAAVLTLLPFSYAEKIGNGKTALDLQNCLQKFSSSSSNQQKSPDLADVILRGFYPEISSKRTMDRQLWCGSYITTYLERDIRSLGNVSDLSQFERFVKLCAVRTGQILNLSDLARDTGISVSTASKWISLLETGYQIYLLQPYYQNIGKRIIKSPKLYFNDTALASYLLGIHDKQTLYGSPHFGNLFETMIVSDFLKRFYNYGQMPGLYYLRTRDGLEVDLVIELKEKLYLFEIKTNATITSSHAVSLKRLQQEMGGKIASSSVISCASSVFSITDHIQNIPWYQLLAK
jgi:predicted AAA+ superfamily ATPase